jgi:eukaryotic-like serine/threonine-protein kinase
MPEPELGQVATSAAKARQLSLDGFLGKGAFKETFRAITGTGEVIALKVAPTSDSLHPRLQRETQALAECSHPAIARLLDSFELSVDGGRYWISLEEFVGGGTLADALALSTMAPQQVRAVMTPIADALGHLHERQLVHRDIKPANILFRSETAAVLTDFGLVRILDKSSLTHDFLAMGPGTPLYASPEQLLNEKSEIDWRSDQFAFALVACRCLLGVHPFAPSGTAHDAVVRVAERGSIEPGVASQLEDLGFTSLVRALDPWPVRRYRWPDQFLAEFQKPGGA